MAFTVKLNNFLILIIAVCIESYSYTLQKLANITFSRSDVLITFSVGCI